MSFSVRFFKQTEILPYINGFVDMRLKAFYQFPYLYVGTKKSDASYAKEYAVCPEGIFVVAFKNEVIAGICSGMPLNASNSPLKPWLTAFLTQGINLDETYYIGELIIKPRFQKQKCCALLITRFIEIVKSMNFLKILGVTCIREKTHPLCPGHYFDPESIWKKIDAQKIDLILSAKWATRQKDGSLKMENNKLACWTQSLSETMPKRKTFQKL